MSKTGSKILQGAREALSVAKGEIPAASITVNGHRYVPADRITALEKENAELRETAAAVIEQWDTPNWKLEQPTAGLIGNLRAALRDGGEE